MRVEQNGSTMLIDAERKVTVHDLNYFKQCFSKGVNDTSIFYFDVSHVSLPSISVSWNFGKYMLAMRPMMRGKISYIRASNKIRVFLNAFFKIFPPITTIVWTDLSQENFLVRSRSI